MNWAQKEPRYGDIIRVKVKFYYHYGIYADDATVIQFGFPDNTGIPNEEIKVLTTDITTFANGSFIETQELDFREKKARRTPEDAVSIALSRVGEGNYNILNNNCEHFVNECVFGEKKSFLDDIRRKIRERLRKQ